MSSGTTDFEALLREALSPVEPPETLTERLAPARRTFGSWKLRELELKAGHASRRGGNKPGPARDYSLKDVRDKERKWIGLAEGQYQRFVTGWKEKPSEVRSKRRSKWYH